MPETTDQRIQRSAEDLALEQREISISEFFTKNRHLLGFDNPTKSLLTTIKEAVDNAIDACEDAGILPTLEVDIEELDGENRYRVSVYDNGPGIVKDQIPKIFGKLLYGSKFHRLKMSRGQQGIGISAAGLYGQLTTGKPTAIRSRTGEDQPAHLYHVQINTSENKPEITKDEEIEWDRERGTEVRIELEGRYQRGHHSIDNYLRQTAVANPHVEIEYSPPTDEDVVYERSTEQLPEEPKEIKPHPYGVELGQLMKMIKQTDHNKVSAFLKNEFSRVSPRVCKEILSKCDDVTTKSWVKSVDLEDAEEIHNAIQDTEIMSPSTNCLSRIGEDLILKGMKDVIPGEKFFAVSRSPEVYRGNPFLVEAGIAYGGDIPADEPVEVLRYANRVPLLYQRSACAVSEAVGNVNWKTYNLNHPKGGQPVAPVVIMVHIASVWVPFTSESKEAIAHYPEILKEVKLALQQVGRKMRAHINKKQKRKERKKKLNYLEVYVPHISEVLKSILDMSEEEREDLEENLEDLLRSEAKIKENGEASS